MYDCYLFRKLDEDRCQSSDFCTEDLTILLQVDQII